MKRLNSILLIEDCEADNYLHKKIINDVGAAKEVIAIRSGDEALLQIRANHAADLPQPELIFLDINTPGMEGWDFVEEFSKFDPVVRDGTLIIMLSGSLNPDDRDRAQSIPLIAEYRTKPLTRDAMRAILEEHFSARR